jgi:hypothetical protein
LPKETRTVPARPKETRRLRQVSPKVEVSSADSNSAPRPCCTACEARAIHPHRLHHPPRNPVRKLLREATSKLLESVTVLQLLHPKSLVLARRFRRASKKIVLTISPLLTRHGSLLSKHTVVRKSHSATPFFHFHTSRARPNLSNPLFRSNRHTEQVVYTLQKPHPFQLSRLFDKLSHTFRPSILLRLSLSLSLPPLNLPGITALGTSYVRRHFASVETTLLQIRHQTAIRHITLPPLHRFRLQSIRLSLKVLVVTHRHGHAVLHLAGSSLNTLLHKPTRLNQKPQVESVSLPA